MTSLRIWGLLLIAGSVITLTLHALEVPEDLYRWLYDHLLSGLDVPDDPPSWSIDAIGYVSLIGGIIELVAGAGLVIADRVRTRPY